MTIEDLKIHLEKVREQGSSYGIERMKALLKALNHPEENLSIIHIAGTNGKGSTLSYLSHILQQASFKTFRYVSPEWENYLDRFLYLDTPVNEEIFLKNMTEVVNTAKKADINPSIFELELACSYLIAKDLNVDYFLQETGMGGRLDATNAIKHPLLVLFSQIDYDHMAYLGNTLEAIATEKAEIIKPSAPVLTTDNGKSVNSILMNKAESVNTPIQIIHAQNIDILSYNETEKTMSFKYKDTIYESRLLGIHQIQNAILAIEAALTLKEKGISINKEQIQKGLKTAVWAGRFEQIHSHPSIFIDGAHNPAAAKALAKNIIYFFPNSKHESTLLLHCFKDKDVAHILEAFQDVVSKLILTSYGHPRSLPAHDLYQLAKNYFPENQLICIDDFQEAVKSGCAQLGTNNQLFIAGSLSHLAHAKKLVLSFFEEKQTDG